MAWTQSTRRHRVGRGSAKHVIQTAIPFVHLEPGRDPQLWWVGPDERGRELEVMAVWQEDLLMFVHVMPVSLRKGKN
ncbi:hypothetical protein GCM10027586_00210 [Kineococcus gypseus]